MLLFTGKGGVGKTTAAAATAVHCAQRGHKTLLLSTDPAHSVADALAVPVGTEPTEVDHGLSAVRVEPQVAVARRWGHLQRYLSELARLGEVELPGVDELSVLPGAEELLALFELREHVASDRWDAVVVDGAATAETLRLLALPAALSGYMERIFPTHRRLARLLRRSRLGGGTVPDDGVLAAVALLQEELADLHGMLADPSLTSVRLVLTPESVVVAETRRAFTALALYGYQVDAVIANRVFPEAGGDPWLAGWAASQRRLLAEVSESFGSVPLWQLGYRAAEPVGVAALGQVATQLYGAADPLAATAPTELIQLVRDGAEYQLRLAVPFAGRDEVGVGRRGDDLVLTVAGRRRLVTLPSVLRRCEAVGARLAEGWLTVRFRPDPAQWPTR